MNDTILQRAVLDIVRDIAQDKRRRNIRPLEVMRPEVNIAVGEALDRLVDRGVLTHRLLSVNKIDAYAVPDASA